MTRLSQLCLTAAAFVSATVASAQGPVAPGHYRLGRPATVDDIRALDIDVRPDGRGLPPGRGTVTEGETVFVAKCAACHGMKGEGLTADRLVGRTAGDDFSFAMNGTLPRTVGSYWPYATTLFDYVRRAMPYVAPHSLTADETYALTAYLLARNGVIGEGDVMNAETLPKVVMPNRANFDSAYREPRRR